MRPFFGTGGTYMSQLLVRGGGSLTGEVAVQGAKNSVLPILAATLMTGGQVELRGCPRLRDVDASIRILRTLGCDARWEGDSLLADTAGLNRCAVSDLLMREMRSSAIFLGAILARCGEAEMSYPGGCELGPRPIDLHLAGLRDLGAEIQDSGGMLRCRAPRLRGRDLVLCLPSVGATENLMLAACGAEGVTTIANAAREPEIVDLQEFLNACGAEVSGAGTSTVTVAGGRPLHGCTRSCRTASWRPPTSAPRPPPAGRSTYETPGRASCPPLPPFCGRRGAPSGRTGTACAVSAGDSSKVSALCERRPIPVFPRTPRRF